MSEKRLASSGDSFVGLTEIQIGDLLNKLSDENTRLHKKVDEQQDQISKLQANVEYLIDSKKELIEKIGEQQATISQLEKNFDDLVKWASEIAKRNVVLDEQIGQLQRENEQLRQKLDFYLLDEFEWKEKYGD